MNYELAKELKDAGFPQTPHYPEQLESVDEGFAYIPTLSELIEACGKGDLTINSYRLIRGVVWFATFIKPIEISDEVFQGKGSTPEEAVARLWLVLNKK